MVTKEELEDMGRKDTIAGAIQNLEWALSKAYPNSVFCIFGSDVHLDPKTGQPKKYRYAAKYGEQKELESEMMHYVLSDSRPKHWLKDLIFDSCVCIMASYSPERILTKAAANLHDAALDYGKSLGLDIESTCSYCRDSAKWKDRIELPQINIHRIGQKVTPDIIEQHITQVREELKRLEEMRNPESMQRMIRDEIKRLKRKNALQAAHDLQDELDRFLAEKERQKRIKEVRMENFKKALEALARWREKKKRAKENRPQPNFAKMAKKKQQQIKQRQAEKKKKKNAGGSDNVKSCSMFNNAG